jgi:hypothetical protein
MLKYIILPHVSTYERLWVRRVMLFVTVPQSLIIVWVDVFRGAWFWWNHP